MRFFAYLDSLGVLDCIGWMLIGLVVAFFGGLLIVDPRKKPRGIVLIPLAFILSAIIVSLTIRFSALASGVYPNLGAAAYFIVIGLAFSYAALALSVFYLALALRHPRPRQKS